MQTVGFQPVSRIETDSGDIRGSSPRGLGFGDGETLERPLWIQIRIENDKRNEWGSGIEGSGRTFFGKKKLPLGFMRTNHKNSKVSIYIPNF